jgi:hypothetical protein
MAAFGRQMIDKPMGRNIYRCINEDIPRIPSLVGVSVEERRTVLA